MSATPAQVANDMAFRAPFWRGRDAAIERMCADAARVIRAYLAGTPPDGRLVTGLLTRIFGVGGHGVYKEVYFALRRAAETIMQLRQEARDAVR